MMLREAGLDRAFLQEFANFVWREEGIARDRALLAAGRQGEAADWLGITEGEIGGCVVG